MRRRIRVRIATVGRTVPTLDNPKHERFAQGLAQGKSQADAYAAAGYAASEPNASRLTRNDKVAARVAEIQNRGAERAEISVAAVLRELWAIGTADPNELIEYRWGCCRNCWGEGHRHQYTEGEMQTRRESHDKKSNLGESEAWDTDGLFDEGGGIGFNATKPPHPECPECFGEGVGRAVARDTRQLSPGARALYAGVKVTKEGLEVKMHDKMAALAKIGQHLGMFVERSMTANVSLEDLLDAIDEPTRGPAKP